MTLNQDDLDLLRFLHRRYTGEKNVGISAVHSSDLDHIADLRACWERLHDAGLVEDDGVSWEISQRGIRHSLACWGRIEPWV